MKDELDIGYLFKQLGRKLAVETVDSLLVGNDMQCFTTQQFMTRYDERQKHKDLMYYDIARMWLGERLTKMLREVKPDVWTPIGATMST